MKRDAGDIKSGVYQRELVLERAELDKKARTVPAALSSEIEVKRWFGTEVLVHDGEAVNMERAQEGLPLLFAHDHRAPIGLVENVRLEGDRLRGTLHFSDNKRAREVWRDVRDGYLKSISVGYRIDRWEEEADSDVVRVTRWTPFEASVVSVPADHTVGVNRKMMENDMPKKTDGPPTETNGGADSTEVNVVDLRQARERARREGIEAAQAEHRERVQKIHDLFTPFLERGPGFLDLRDHLVIKGSNFEQARQALLDMVAGEPAEPIMRDLQPAAGSANAPSEQGRVTVDPTGHRRVQIAPGDDWSDKFRTAAAQAIMVREGILPNDPERRAKIVEASGSNEFMGYTPVELARYTLTQRGVNTGGWSRDKIIAEAIMLPGSTRAVITHTTSDLANVLEDIANKAMQLGYNEAPETWSGWCRTGTLNDFRQAGRPAMSAFSDLDEIGENGEYKYGGVQDLKENIQLATYGKLFSISRQALINDDLDALGRIPQAMGRAASRQVGDVAYAVLTANALMNQDGVALFAAGHNNDVAGGSGAAPSVATIDAARTAMATQTDPSGNANLNISPAYLICPKALEGTSLQIQMAEKDPAIASGEAPNFLRNTFVTIADARLDADDAARWYMAANPAVQETVEVAFLNGQQAPFMESQNGWSTDGVAYKVRIDAAAAALDFRGLYRNDGN